VAATTIIIVSYGAAVSLVAVSMLAAMSWGELVLKSGVI
jgi:hypothetical protein